MTTVLLSRAWSCSVFSVLLLERFEYPQNTRLPTCAHGPKNSYFQDGLRLEMNYAAFQNVADAITLAREPDVPKIPAAAFYALSMKRWGRGAGGNNHRILSFDVSSGPLEIMGDHA
ncbi:hypothetical protein EDC04DRAFT_2724560 [Pisolithus marmoratus]|nr:hypothetical protein EDC04DRAFT_2724560 [Pisolithus marmoratus]